MKTYLTYGVAMSVANLALQLVLYVLGFHSDPAKIGAANIIAMVGGLAISATLLLLGTKARLAEVPATEAFGYGRALGAAVMITLFASLFGVIGQYVYLHLINPGFMEVSVQAQIAKWEEAGMSSAQMEAAEGMMRKMMTPIMQAVFGVIGGMVFGTLVSLLTSIFCRRAATEEPPALA